MPISTPEFHQIDPSLWAWQAYDPAIKTDLFSAALATPAGTYLIDPVPLDEGQLGPVGAIVGIILTNANHQRASAELADRLSAPIFGRPESLVGLEDKATVEVVQGQQMPGELEAIFIDGAAAGEIAIYHSPDGGTMIMGDALIHLEPHGFAFLPRKYCLNEKEMRRSLRQLLARPVERILFAHGTPILSGAKTRLQQLLDSEL